MKYAILIQARSNSHRFPKKIFAKLPAPLSNFSYEEAPMLLHLYSRAKKIDDKALVLLLIPKEDTLLEDWCKTHEINYFSGSV